MNGVTLLDGGFGTMLQASGVALPALPDEVNITAPEAVTAIHARYVEAGSRVIIANTFGLSGRAAGRSAYGVARLTAAAVAAAKKAAGEQARVALDIGPTGELLEPYGTLTEHEARARFSALIAAREGAEQICIETMTDLREALAALRAAKEGCDLPVWVTLSFQQNGRTMMGDTPEQVVRALEEEGADAIGLNCSLGPRESLPIFRELARFARVPLIAKPNAGMPDPVTGAYPMGPEEFAACMLEFKKAGARCLGGCCGTTPAYIAALRARLEEEEK